MALSLVFIITTFVISIYCIIDYNELNKTAKKKLEGNHLILLQKWKYIPYLIILIILLVLGYIATNIYKVITEK